MQIYLLYTVTPSNTLSACNPLSPKELKISMQLAEAEANPPIHLSKSSKKYLNPVYEYSKYTNQYGERK
jgi:hypothetical protein